MVRDIVPERPGSLDYFQAKMIQDRRGRRMDQRVEDRNRQHGSITFRNLSQDRHLGFVEFGKRDDEDFLDLVGIRAESLAGFGPDDDGGHSKARAGREIIELPEYVCGRQLESDLFVGFAKRGLYDGFAAVESAAGKRELARVMSEAGRAPCDEETGFVVLVGCDDEGDGGGAQRRIRLILALETR